MEITWYGHSCFRLTERNLVMVATDPYDNQSIGYFPLKLKADIVTISHDSPGHNNSDAVKGSSHVIDGPGEFEIGGVFITGVQTDGSGGGKKSKEQIRNTLYVFDYDGLTVAHLGDLQQVPFSGNGDRSFGNPERGPDTCGGVEVQRLEGSRCYQLA